MASTHSADASYWQRQTRLLQWRINSAWLLDRLQSTLFLAALAATGLVLLGRREAWSQSALGWGCALFFGAALGAAFWRTRPRFISPERAQAELESQLNLHNRLSAAAAGVGSWPARTQWRSGAWQWQWRKLVLWPTLSAALVLTALWIPIQILERTSNYAPLVKPPALANVEEWLEELRSTPSVEPASLETLEAQAEQLAAQPPADWYSHSSLEAADHLQAQLSDGMKALDQNAAALQSLLGSSQQLSEAEAKRWTEQLGQALQSLEGNMPSLQRSLSEQLRSLDPSKMRSLTPDQLQKLQKQLSDARGACKIPGNGLADGNSAAGDSTKEGEGQSGAGGITRGPGHPPLSLGAEATNLNTEKTESLDSEDFQRAALGDLAGLSDSQHQVDKAANHRTNQGGTVSTRGAGPDAVWVQPTLPPAERERLRQFYR